MSGLTKQRDEKSSLFLTGEVTKVVNKLEAMRNMKILQKCKKNLTSKRNKTENKLSFLSGTVKRCFYFLFSLCRCSCLTTPPSPSPCAQNLKQGQFFEKMLLFLLGMLRMPLYRNTMHAFFFCNFTVKQPYIYNLAGSPLLCLFLNQSRPLALLSKSCRKQRSINRSMRHEVGVLMRRGLFWWKYV